MTDRKDRLGGFRNQPPSLSPSPHCLSPPSFPLTATTATDDNHLVLHARSLRPTSASLAPSPFSR